MLSLVKIALSAGLIYLVNEVVIRHSRPALGSLIASLPLVSLITFIWIYYGLSGDPATRDERLASHSTGVFWFVIPSLPMFLVFPALLRKGISFWPNLLICCGLTMVLYLAMVAVLRKFGIEI